MDILIPTVMNSKWLIMISTLMMNWELMHNDGILNTLPPRTPLEHWVLFWKWITAEILTTEEIANTIILCLSKNLILLPSGNKVSWIKWQKILLYFRKNQQGVFPTQTESHKHDLIDNPMMQRKHSQTTDDISIKNVYSQSKKPLLK